MWRAVPSKIEISSYSLYATRDFHAGTGGFTILITMEKRKFFITTAM